MPTVDLIAGVVLLGLLVWGCWTGLAGTMTFAGFAVGAVVGAHFAPQVLPDGSEDDFALVFALPAALLLGGIVGAVVERKTVRFRRRLDRVRRLRFVNAIGGMFLAAGIGAVVVWLLAAPFLQIDKWRDPIEESEVAGRLVSVLRPPGPAAAPADRPFDSFPTVAGSGPPILPVDPEIEEDPQVRFADRSVVKVGTVGCGRAGLGSGWIAAPGIVATNAHVTAGSEIIAVRLRGRGPAYPGTPIWFDARNDVSLIRVPGLQGARPLPMLRRARSGASGATLGFPLGQHAIRATRLGPTTDEDRGTMEGGIPPYFPRRLRGRLITTLRGEFEPGNSGGPVVDSRGRVLTMVFGAREPDEMGVGKGGMGVPNQFVRRALRRAGPTVGTGPC